MASFSAVLLITLLGAAKAQNCGSVASSAVQQGDACMQTGYTMPKSNVDEFAAATKQICSCRASFESSVAACRDDPASEGIIRSTINSYSSVCTGYSYGEWFWRYGMALVLVLILACSICCCLQCLFCGTCCCCRPRCCFGGKARGILLESDSSTETD
eukprot:TRINITY_DN38436_c0_g1_i1.p1 TRINITY_DN38436_c0_g1~~TRINITY_DN38436_c0_g1_i1.p1  ORF type:complete len:158 (-),score=22.62 TRINITY_DN38436_c0_g1_i1:159-632(-)